MDVVKKTKVLVVEDSKMALKIAVAILSSFNCEIFSAELGADAIELVKKHRFDIIFMDLGLPDMDGLSLSHLIRKMEGDERRTPIVALTAHSEGGLKELGSLEVLDDYLLKPISTENVGRVLGQFKLV